MRLTARSWLAVVLAAFALVAVPATALGDTFRVKATDEQTWHPARRRIHRGDKVVWKNPTNFTHTVTAYSNNWDKNTVLNADERTSKIFHRKGVYKYRCTIHSTLVNGTCSGMCGRIRVRA